MGYGLPDISRCFFVFPVILIITFYVPRSPECRAEISVEAPGSFRVIKYDMFPQHWSCKSRYIHQQSFENG